MRKRTIQEILSSTIKALMNDKSIDEITVKEILRESGVGRATFYKYFFDKQALLEYVFQNELVMPYFWDFSTNLPERSEMFLKHLMENRRFILNGLKSTGQNSLYQIWLTQAINSVQAYFRLQPECKSISDDDLSFYARCISYACVNINIEWLETECPLPPYDLARKLNHILTGGIRGIIADVLSDSITDRSVQQPTED